VGYEISVDGGRRNEPAPCACPPGTTVEVRNLFFNTPVRRKFMRSVPTELGHATEAFMRVALAYPRRHFGLQHHDRTVHELPAVDRWLERIAALFGPELAESLIWVESHDAELRLSGYVANPTHSRSNNKLQYLFLNGRHIRDRSLQHALGEAYRGLLLSGRFPIAFLRLEMPPEQIDVNVHPTKLEVRFQDSGRVYGQLLSMIRGHFLSTDLTARVQPSAESPAAAPVPRDESSPLAAGVAEQVRERAVQWARGESAAGRPTPAGRGTLRFDPPPPVARFSLPASDTSASPGAPDAPAAAASRNPAFQAHQRYLVVAAEEGLMVIDQHALHERILYEQFREKVLAGRVEVQRLLAPEPLDLAPSEAAALLENQAVLSEIGLEVTPFGGSSVLVQGYPAMLGKVEPAELVRQLAGQLAQSDRLPQRRDVLDELLHMMSCKAAIKAGDPLSPAEVEALLEYRHLVQDAHHCPHGRPTTLVFTREELDRRFKRI
jgi:DNA mismatch repair protein MutL